MGVILLGTERCQKMYNIRERKWIVLKKMQLSSSVFHKTEMYALLGRYFQMENWMLKVQCLQRTPIFMMFWLILAMILLSLKSASQQSALIAGVYSSLGKTFFLVSSENGWWCWPAPRRCERSSFPQPGSAFPTLFRIDLRQACFTCCQERRCCVFSVLGLSCLYRYCLPFLGCLN